MIYTDIVSNYIVNRKSLHVFFIGIGGNIASGKSTFAKQLKKQIQIENPSEVVEIISTDDFLLTNAALQRLDLFDQKGWQESYDTQRIQSFFSELDCYHEACLPTTYSQRLGDIIPYPRRISHPTIVILEGSMVFSDLFAPLLDFSCYLEVDLELNFEWYVSRSLANLATKKEYQHFSTDQALQVITTVWQETNLVAYTHYILPYKQMAHVIIQLDASHQIQEIMANHLLTPALT